MANYVVAMGDFVDGTVFYGPFEDYDDALAYGEDEGEDCEWRIIKLISPDEEDNPQ